MSNVPPGSQPPGSGGWQPPSGGTPPPPPPGSGWQQEGGYGQSPPPAYGYQQQPSGAPMGPGGQPLAAWWKRLVAIILDSLIVGVPFGILAAIVAAAAAEDATIDPITGELESGGAEFGGAVILIYALALVVAVLYYGLLNGGANGQTLGKKVLNIRVRDANTGGPIGVGRGIGRYFVGLILGAVCFIGAILNGLWPLWDQKRQALHDKAVSSVVVDA